MKKPGICFSQGVLTLPHTLVDLQECIRSWGVIAPPGGTGHVPSAHRHVVDNRTDIQISGFTFTIIGT